MRAEAIHLLVSPISEALDDTVIRVSSVGFGKWSHLSLDALVLSGRRGLFCFGCDCVAWMFLGESVCENTRGFSRGFLRGFSRGFSRGFLRGFVRENVRGFVRENMRGFCVDFPPPYVKTCVDSS